MPIGKRLTAFIIVVVLFAAATIYAGAQTDQIYVGLLGDTDTDGAVTIKDATLIQKYLVGAETFTEDDLILANVDSTGVSVKSVTWIQRFLSGFTAEGLYIGQPVYKREMPFDENENTRETEIIIPGGTELESTQQETEVSGNEIVVYQFKVKTDKPASCVEGALHYDADKLKLVKTAYPAYQKNKEGLFAENTGKIKGVVLFNYGTPSDVYDFTREESLITATFEVLDNTYANPVLDLKVLCSLDELYIEGNMSHTYKVLMNDVVIEASK